MIKKLQALKARKGFTIIELIVVIAIMAVLMAIIFPMLTSDSSRKQEANSAARDFYAAIQTIITKYSMYEGPLSPMYHDNPNLGEIRYYDNLGGNYPYRHREGVVPPELPIKTSIYVEFTTKNNNITNVCTHVIDELDPGYNDGMGLFELCKKESSLSEFGRLLRDEAAKRINYQDGYYYAKITYEDDDTLTTTTPSKMELDTVKVEYTGYSRRPLPSATNFTVFKNSAMIFGDDYKLNNGEIFGVCASYDAATGRVVGLAGSTLT